MELESEGRAILSPGARVIVGTPLVGLLCAAALGFLLGVVLTTLLRRSRPRWRERRPEGVLGPPFRMPSENPDVETEL